MIRIRGGSSFPAAKTGSNQAVLSVHPQRLFSNIPRAMSKQRRLLVSIVFIALLGTAAAASGQTTPPEQSPQPINDVTFFVIGDPQINIPRWGTAGTEKTIEIMNAVPGKPFPFGGVVAEPRGVLIAGDLVDDLSNDDNWTLYKKLFDVHGKARLRFPVYEGLGNHDLDGKQQFGTFNKLQREFVERNKSRAGIFYYDRRHYHYSWDWDQLHLVCLNVFPGNDHRPVYDRVAPWNDPKFSLEFLIDDLKKNVGDSGRPVILYWHYGLRGWGLEKWWTLDDLAALHAAIASYNVVLILHGHEHRYERYEWEGYPVIMAPSPQYDRDPNRSEAESRPKGFLVVRAKDNELQVAHHTAEGWRETWSRTIALGQPRNLPPSPPRPNGAASPRTNGILDKQKMLDRQTWWDNCDWDWYREKIPFFESPDPNFDTTYYYRWEMMTKHLVYGSPETGYTFTEFIDRPGWSGAYGAISCPLGHHFCELRWLKDRRVTQDYARYWHHTPGAQPRSYSNWFGDAMWAVYQVWGDVDFIQKMLSDMESQFRGWESRHYNAEYGMFRWNGMQDGMETNINSRQTDDWFRGAEGYRPTLNSYLYGDAVAISKAAALAGDVAKSREYAAKAASLRKNVQEKLWDPNRSFFFHMFARDEKDGIKAGTLTYQTGLHAGSPHGRELIGYIPWQFNLPEPGHEAAWKYLMDPRYFYAPFGPTTVERNDPLFRISPNCCVWSGNSWPYATSQTLDAFANLLNNYQQNVVSKDDYLKLLRIYTLTHRMEGRPYLAEALHPDTGSFSGHNVFNHSEHYFHSSYINQLITGLVGLRPQDRDMLVLNPLVPDEWDYFSLDDVSYRGRNVSIVWDRDGTRYNQGKGLTVIVDGLVLANSPTIGKLEIKLPGPTPAVAADRPHNFAVNNDGEYFPALRASYSNGTTPLGLVQDGNYWYHVSPPNRWTTEGSPNKSDWLELAFGIARPVESVKLYFLDDGQTVRPPVSYELQQWVANEWLPVRGQQRYPEQPTGRRPNIITFPKIDAEKLRVVFTHQPGSFTGLTEWEAWAHAELPLPKPTAEVPNLAYNPGNREFPKATASHTSRFDRIQEINDGRSFFSTNSRNRWTAYESPNPTDWVEIDFGGEKIVSKVDIHLWADQGGVRAPRRYQVTSWDGSDWVPAKERRRTPEQPRASMINTVEIEPVMTNKIRIIFEHDGRSRSGVTELMIWDD
jgi:hypothetical protein